MSGAEVASGNIANIEGKWIIIDQLPAAGTSNITELTLFEVHPNGHIRFKGGSIYYRYPGLAPAPGSGKFINGNVPVKRLGVKFKTIINPNWSETRILQEHTTAIFNKKFLSNMPTDISGQIIKEYRSQFTDGTKVEIYWHNFHKVGSQTYNNVYTVDIIF